MEIPKTKMTNREILGLSWWAIKFWWKYDTSGFILYLASEIYDGVSAVVGAYITGLLISELLNSIKSGKELLPSVWWILLFYGIYLFAGYLSAQLNRMTTTQRVVRINNVLEQLYGYKIKELTLFDVDGREFANKFELAKDAKKTMSSKFVFFANLIKYPAIVILVSIPLFIQGYWYVVVLVSLLSIPASLANSSTTKKKIQYRLENVESLRAATETIGYYQSSSDGSKEIKVHGSHALFFNKGTDKLVALMEHTLVFERERFWKRLSLNILDSAVTVGAVLAYVIRIGKDAALVGGVLPYISMISKVRGTFLNFSQQYTQIAESVDEVMRVKDFLELQPQQLFAQNGTTLTEEAPSIQLNGVKFTYPNTERMVLDGIDIEIGAGEKIAIVGENGVGKTTLLKLIMGMYKASEGTILFNGRDQFTYSSASYYDSLGVLFQAFPQYPALTVRDNVAVGRYTVKIDDAKVLEALKLADAWNFVEKYPKQLDQILSHRYKDGISPSTGQWQKLAIARLFYRDPKVVLFDEPTASIDAESEYKIFNEIFSFFKKKTVIIVSHRFSTVRNADKIIVVKDGKIAEQGTHEELLALKSVYASAYQKQAEGYKD